MKVLATSFGSSGDFLPTLALAASLRQAGHDVRLVANPFYETAARKAALPLLPAGEHYDIYQKIEDAPGDLEGGVKAGMALYRTFAVPNDLATFPVMREAIRIDRPDVVVCSYVSFGGLFAALEAKVPTVVVAATPLSWVSGRSAMVITDRPLPRFLRPWSCAAVRAALVVFLGRELKKSAQRLGADVHEISLAGLERQVKLHVGLWSPLLRPSIPGDPPRTTVCGFARGGHLGGPEDGLDPRLEAFLREGPPPVVVGFGSLFGRRNGPLLGELARACDSVGKRCVVISANAPALNLPRNTLAVAYAPYHLVFPRAAAVVIHAGAGTCSEALLAGRPIVALPFGFDQYDLAWQLEQLGAAVRVPKATRSPQALVRAIASATGDAALAKRAAELGRRFGAERDGAEVAADLVARL